MVSATRMIRPDDLDLILQIPEVAGVCRDEEMRMIWGTPLFFQWGVVVSGNNNLMGKRLHDSLPFAAAEERTVIQRRVMETGRAEHHYQLSKDRRVLCSVFPLDAQAFGHRGILALVKDSPHPFPRTSGLVIPVISTPNLVKLASLSIRELEVLHPIAGGKTTQEVANSISRASKTVEHHINSIHGKLGMGSRAQLVRWASERGIQSFSDEEWMSIVAGTRLIRKELVKTQV